MHSAGNNAVEMQTTAVYDKVVQEFVVHTPSALAQKYWITNSAVHAKWCVVFAQLLIEGTNHGIHGFLVRIRNEVSPHIRVIVVLPALQMQGLVTAGLLARTCVVAHGYFLLLPVYPFSAQADDGFRLNQVAEVGSRSCASSAGCTHHTIISDQPSTGRAWRSAQQTVQAQPPRCPSLPAGHEHLPGRARGGYGAQAGLQRG